MEIKDLKKGDVFYVIDLYRFAIKKVEYFGYYKYAIHIVIEDGVPKIMYTPQLKEHLEKNLFTYKDAFTEHIKVTREFLESQETFLKEFILEGKKI